MHKTIIFICEGETEEEFCKKLLKPYFQEKKIHCKPQLIEKSGGGMVSWDKIKNQISKNLQAEKSTAFVTTFIDYYGIRGTHKFPRWEEKQNGCSDTNKQVKYVEEGMKSEIEEKDKIFRNKFIPYIQLHEFEALLFYNTDTFKEKIGLDKLKNLTELEKILNDFDNPERINNGKETSPSHRLKKIIKGYNKIQDGVKLAQAIGLEKIREKCPRFNGWIKNIEEIYIS